MQIEWIFLSQFRSTKEQTNTETMSPPESKTVEATAREPNPEEQASK